MEIERLWGKYPGWLMEQDVSTMTTLLGWYRVNRKEAAGADSNRRPSKR